MEKSRCSKCGSLKNIALQLNSRVSVSVSLVSVWLKFSKNEDLSAGSSFQKHREHQEESDQGTDGNH